MKDHHFLIPRTEDLLMTLSCGLGYTTSMRVSAWEANDMDATGFPRTQSHSQ